MARFVTPDGRITADQHKNSTAIYLAKGWTMLVEKEADDEVPEQQETEVEKVEETDTRCVATTKSGERCKGTAINDGLCMRHFKLEQANE